MVSKTILSNQKFHPNCSSYFYISPNNYVRSLEDIIDHCLSPEAGGYTPSDFPEVGLSKEALDELLAEMG